MRLEDGKVCSPICPFPAVAMYKGSGDAKDGGNFTCVTKETE
jgi:hypothetical protein